MLEEEKKIDIELKNLKDNKEENIIENSNEKFSGTEEKKLDYIKEILDFWKDLLIIIIIVLVVRTYLVIPFKISGQSMYKSYYDKEFIIVDRFSYLDIPNIKKWDPNRWDVIVFKPNISKDKEYYIKRIIWLPWDKLKIEWWKVYLFDKLKNKYNELKEWYLSEDNKDSTFVWIFWSWAVEYNVPNDWYFVMWDNRQNSTDSRECFASCFLPSWRWNYIKKDDIIWNVLIDLWYYNWIDEISFKPFSIKFWNFSFFQPTIWIDSHPRWFNSPRKYNYE